MVSAFADWDQHGTMAALFRLPSSGSSTTPIGGAPVLGSSAPRGPPGGKNWRLCHRWCIAHMYVLSKVPAPVKFWGTLYLPGLLAVPLEVDVPDDANARYRRSAKFRAVQRKYKCSPKGRASQARYGRSAKGLATARRYRARCRDQEV